MEHLLIPSSAKLTEDDEVRYVADQYDRGPFLTWPTRHERKEFIIWDRKDKRGILNSKEPEVLANLFQTWFFFGLLHEFFGDDFQQEDCIRVIAASPEERRVVCTERLMPLLSQWVDKARDPKTNLEYRLLGRVENLKDCLNLVHDLSQSYFATNFGRNIKISIASVAEQLAIALQYSFSYVPSINWTSSLDGVGLDWTGWCPFNVSAINISIAFSQTAFYLGRLGRLDTWRDHSHCTGAKCQWSQIELLAQQEPKHRIDCSLACEEIVIVEDSMQKILRILEQDKIPILQIESNGRVVDIIPNDTVQTYTAISHVWADGLGNRCRNSLPKCQMSYLKNLIQAFTSAAHDQPVYLWIDTLCCPIEPPSAQSKAISLMRRTYAEADHVLVLDSELEKVHATQIDLIEQCARILTSTWMKRLWTLQEGVLAKQLWVQFADGARNMDIIFNDYTSHCDLSNCAVCSDLCNWIKKLRPKVRSESQVEPEPFAVLKSLSDGVQYRGVSVPSDEPLCIGTLLNLDVGTLSRQHGDERVSLLWRLIYEKFGLPKGLIFSRATPLQIPGYRWAPSSLLQSDQQPHSRFMCTEAKATLTDGGLIVEFPGARLNAAVGDWRDPTRSFEQSMIPLVKIEGSDWATIHAHEGFEPHLAEVFENRRHTQYAILFDDTKRANGSVMGLLMKQTQACSDSFHWRRMCCVWLKPCAKAPCTVYDAAWEACKGIKGRTKRNILPFPKSYIPKRTPELEAYCRPRVGTPSALKEIEHAEAEIFRRLSAAGSAGEQNSSGSAPIDDSDEIWNFSATLRLLGIVEEMIYGWHWRLESLPLNQKWCID